MITQNRRPSGCETPGETSRGLRLLACAGVPVQRASRDSAVDQLTRLLSSASIVAASPRSAIVESRFVSVLIVEWYRRFSSRSSAAVRIRFFCCLMFAISEKRPRLRAARRAYQRARDGRRVTEPPRIAHRGRHPRAAAAPRLAGSTAIFWLATGLSRVLGLVREIVASYYFGSSGRSTRSRSRSRSRISSARWSPTPPFVGVRPVFSDLLEKGERKRAWRLASSLFWLMLLGLTALTALFILVAPWVDRHLRQPGHDRSLAVGLSRVLFPIVGLLGLSGIIVGILNTYDHFTVPALSPVFWNLAIIVGLVIGVPQAHSMNTKLYIYAASILVATVIRTSADAVAARARSRRGRCGCVIDWRDPMSGGLQADDPGHARPRPDQRQRPDRHDLRLSSHQRHLAPTAINKAFLIYMLPQGMFSVAIATVLFPSLSRLRRARDMDGFRRRSDAVSVRSRSSFPAAVVSAVLAEPIVRILYQYGACSPARPRGSRRASPRSAPASSSTVRC